MAVLATLVCYHRYRWCRWSERFAFGSSRQTNLMCWWISCVKALMFSRCHRNHIIYTVWRYICISHSHVFNAHLIRQMIIYYIVPILKLLLCMPFYLFHLRSSSLKSHLKCINITRSVLTCGLTQTDGSRWYDGRFCIFFTINILGWQGTTCFECIRVSLSMAAVCM